MRSSYGLSTCTLLARGVDYEMGSARDTMSRMGLEHERKVLFAQTQLLVNAIMTVGSAIVSSVTKSDAQSDDKAYQKSYDAFRDLLLPELKEDQDKKAGRAKEILEEEIRKGGFYVEPMEEMKRRPNLKKRQKDEDVTYD